MCRDNSSSFCCIAASLIAVLHEEIYLWEKFTRSFQCTMIMGWYADVHFNWSCGHKDYVSWTKNTNCYAVDHLVRPLHTSERCAAFCYEVFQHIFLCNLGSVFFFVNGCWSCVLAIPLKFCRLFQWIKCKIIGNQMQNAVAMGSLKSLITQIIASHVKLN
jgi:hypothetical protein